jgi:hypothetical protein
MTDERDTMIDKPHAHPPQVSPFLPVQWGTFGYVFQFLPTPVAIPDSGLFDYGVLRIKPQFAVRHVDEAENAYLASGHVVDEVWDARTSHRYAYQPFTKGVWMACTIRKNAALIAARGRRGYANIVLMHPAMVEQIGRENLVDPAQFEDAGSTLGRWTRTAEVPKSDLLGSTIWCASHLPTDEAFVIFTRGLVDAGGVLLNDGSGNLSLAMQAVTDRTGPQQYVTRIRFSEATP